MISATVRFVLAAKKHNKHQISPPNWYSCAGTNILKSNVYCLFRVILLELLSHVIRPSMGSASSDLDSMSNEIILNADYN